jgi:hypothetical protein
MTTVTSPPAPSADPVSKQLRGRRAVLVVFTALVLVLVGVAGRAGWGGGPADIRDGTVLVNQDGLAARYGIAVTLVAVTAAGGLVELRYQVVDPDKATRIVHDAALAPALVVESTGETLRMASPPHHHGAELQLGGTYYFLMANAHNAIHRGDRVTLVVGDARLEHVTAEG